MLRKPLPDHRNPYFPPVVGPFKLRYWPIKEAKMEIWCHVCPYWSDMVASVLEADAVIQRHFFEWHWPVPKPDSNDRLDSPGR